LFLTVLLLSLPVRAHEGSVPIMDFVPPAPGSYRLERIFQAPEGAVLDTSGRPQALAKYTGGKITVLSFVYMSCSDTAGCPYAFHVLHMLEGRLKKEPALAERVRLVSLSFDPVRDTPREMARYAGGTKKPRHQPEWAYLTTASRAKLLPILDGFGQDVDIIVDPKTGEPDGKLSHVLRVFLLDGKGSVREIYTTTYLFEDVVYNDIKTLAMEEGFTVK
jgi:cytochrome oxidase Cu insertion factor (SCO1/SenC/PrrC family)